MVPVSDRQSAKHYRDGIGICLKCDQCDVEECCPQTEECLGTNWDFMTNGVLEEFVRKTTELRKMLDG